MTSKPFCFIVDGYSFYINRALIAARSPAISGLMDATIKERSEERVQFEGVELATFKRFMYWLYHGDYTLDEHDQRATDSHSQP